MTSVQISSIEVTTIGYAELATVNVGYTTITVSWVNTAVERANFRVKGFSDEEETLDSFLGVEGGETGLIEFPGLIPGVTYTFYLYKGENSKWVQQSSETSGIDGLNVLSLTTHLSGISTSVGPNTAVIQWPVTYDASYQVSVLNEAGESSGVHDTITSTSDTHQVVVRDLESSTNYTVELSATESEASTLISSASFGTSSVTTFQLDSVFASYAIVSWTGDGFGESDGVADFRITGKLTSDSDFDTLMESTPDSIKTMTIENLLPGKAYTFRLQRLSVEGDWTEEAEIEVTTLTTSVSVTLSGSRTIQLEWPSIYTGAEYKLTYTPSGGEAVVYKDGPISDVSATLTDLEPATSYVIDLTVEEFGEPVELSTLGLEKPKQTASLKMKIMLMIVAMIITGIAFKTISTK